MFLSTGDRLTPGPWIIAPPKPKPISSNSSRINKIGSFLHFAHAGTRLPRVRAAHAQGPSHVCRDPGPKTSAIDIGPRKW